MTRQTLLSGRPPARIQFLDSEGLTTNLSSYTHSGMSIGSAASNRRVFAVVYGRTGTGSQTITSATIGGVAATIHVQTAGNGGSILGIISAIVPTGTTADVVVNYSTTLSGAGCATLKAQDLLLATARDTDTDAADTANAMSTTIDMLPDGFTISAAVAGGDPTWTWSGTSGVTEVLDLLTENRGFTVAIKNSVITNKSATCIATASGAITEEAMVTASFR